MDLAAIVFIAEALDVTSFFETIDELYGAVMLDSELFGEVADGPWFLFIQAADREEHLVLLRLETLRVGRGVAGAEEESDAVAQFSKGAVFAGSDFFRHEFIIS